MRRYTGAHLMVNGLPLDVLLRALFSPSRWRNVGKLTSTGPLSPVPSTVEPCATEGTQGEESGGGGGRVGRAGPSVTRPTVGKHGVCQGSTEGKEVRSNKRHSKDFLSVSSQRLFRFSTTHFAPRSRVVGT